MASDLTREEQRLRGFLLILAPVFAALAVSYVLQGILPDPGSEFPFVANSLAKDGTFAVLCLVAAADIRRHTWAVWVVIGAHGLLIFGLLISLWLGNTESVEGSFAAPFGLSLPSAEVIFWLWLGLATAVTAALLWCAHSAARARYRLLYLAPHQHRTLVALAEVLVLGGDEAEALTAEEVARNVDEYLASFPAREKSKTKLALTALTIYPLIRLRPPYPLMAPETRLAFVERCFIRDVAEHRLPDFLRRLLQSMLFAAQQLTFIGYYSDPRAAQATGYVRFADRAGGGAPADLAIRPYERLRVRSPAEVDGAHVTADVAIIGSGAAGALLAYRLAERGREVLVLERGPHVDPSEFTDDERRQFASLYRDGGMQMSTDARFQVLQGRCVGGTTVVNNAVCFELPEHVLERWNDPDGLSAGLDPQELDAAFERLRELMPIARQRSRRQLAGGARKFRAGIEQLGLDRAGDFDIVEANIADCLGCGYCNIGCPFGRKLSALDYTLPGAQARFGDAVRILSECSARRITPRNGGSAGVECELSDGRRLDIRANTVVLAGGAIGSSLVLQRSALGGARVGRGVSFNLGAPISAEFDEKLDSYAGLQISHYLRPPGDDGLILETWFNPVGAQSLFMPGWFRDHFRNMRAYDRMASAGSVVGTRPDAKVSLSWRGRLKLDYEPHPDDLKRLVAGLKLAGRIYLAAGAKRVTPTTFRHAPSTSPDQLDQLDRLIHDNTDVQLHSSHPQGGNAIGTRSDAVVDPEFRVRGAPGVYACDASVFPAAITVNPQMTVMALAEYAAPLID